MLSRIISSLIRLFTGTQARWSGCDPAPTQRVYFANHTSNLDFLALWSVIPDEYRSNTRPVAAHDYWTSNRTRKFLADRVFRALLIERRKVTKSNNPMTSMLEAIDQGESLIIFPEGGRSATDTMMPFKSGIYHLAKQRPEIEFIPSFIENLNRVLPKGEILPLPLICSVTFGSPMKIEVDEDKDAFLGRARQAIEEMLTS
jgi:1-acyl-sn-glycerol-3-phosphate acyltransferase